MNNIVSYRPLRFVSMVMLLVVTFAIYFQVRQFSFINYDDNWLLVYNGYVRTGLSLENLKWAFTSTDMLQWVPLTWLSHMFDFQIYGARAGGHHMTNVIIHILNTSMLMLFLFRSTNEFWRSYFVAALFALHPLHVEPVAWVTARKDLLSTFFLFTTLIFYLRYVARPNLTRYSIVVGGYMLTLMSKPMAVTLPMLLLLLDYWPLKRMQLPKFPAQWRQFHQFLKLFREKIPLFILSFIFSFIAFYTQSKADAVSLFGIKNLASQISHVGLNYTQYIFKTFWPSRLAIIYPYHETISYLESTACIALLIVVTLAVCKYSSTRHYYLISGWGWFLISLLPVIGIVRIGSASIADKFTYIPIIGLFIMITWGISELCYKYKPANNWKILTVVCVMVLTALIIKSWQYIGCWKDSKTIHTEALLHTTDNFVALGNLGDAYSLEGNHEKALEYYLESIRAEPRFEIGYANIGYIYLMKKEYQSALPYFASALQLRPDYERAKAGLDACLYNIQLVRR